MLKISQQVVIFVIRSMEKQEVERVASEQTFALVKI